MELYDENIINKKKSKIPMIIGILIVFLIIVTVAIIYGIMYLKSTVITARIDGQKKNNIVEILYFKEENGSSKVYIPIRKILILNLDMTFLQSFWGMKIIEEIIR